MNPLPQLQSSYHDGGHHHHNSRLSQHHHNHHQEEENHNTNGDSDLFVVNNAVVTDTLANAVDLCNCCPYGFHIDTDFVRYCDALLTALYNQSTNNSHNNIGGKKSPEIVQQQQQQRQICCSYSSIERNFQIYFNQFHNDIDKNHNDDDCAAASGDYNNDFNLKLIMNNNNGDVIVASSPPSCHSPYQNGHNDENDHQSDVISNSCTITTAATKNTSTCDGNGNSIDDFDDHDSSRKKDYSSIDSVSNVQYSHEYSTKFDNDDHDHFKNEMISSNITEISIKLEEEDEYPPSLTSSCRSSTVSKTVLTQIRNHLALSLKRVKELENQVALIPSLKNEIKKLEQERQILFDKINSNHKNFEDDVDDDDIKSKSINGEENPKSDKKSSFSIENFDSITVCPEEKSYRSVGTLTNFAPCIMFRNVFVQTDLKMKDVKFLNKDYVETKEIMTMTEEEKDDLSFEPGVKNVEQNQEKSDQNETNSIINYTENKKIYQEKASQTDLIEKIYVDRDQQHHHHKNGLIEEGEKEISTDGQVQQQVKSLNLNSDSKSIGGGRTTPHLLLETDSIGIATPTSSTQSIRLCEKCNEMIVSNHFVESYHHHQLGKIDGGGGSVGSSSPQATATISLPKIIKTDSGISVERRNLIDENDSVVDFGNNSKIILVYPMSNNNNNNGGAGGSFEHSPMSAATDESECCSSSSSKDYFKSSTTVVVGSPSSSINQTTNLNHNIKQPSPPISTFNTSSEIKGALKIINDNLFSHKKSFLFSKSVAVVKKNWFKISSSVDSDYRAVEAYLDFIEKYSTKLLDFIVNLSDTNGNTAIHYAISYNNFDIVSILLDSKICDVNKYNKAGYTATMLVSLAKIENELYRDIVERLFNQADVNLKAKQNGQTALMLAASHGRVEISKILLECGAEVNLQDNDGSTALMCAAEHGHLEVISLLLSQPDCDPLIEDNEGSTALKIALVNGHNDIGVLLYAGTRKDHNSYHNSDHSTTKTNTTTTTSEITNSHHKRARSFKDYSNRNYDVASNRKSQQSTTTNENSTSSDSSSSIPRISRRSSFQN